MRDATCFNVFAAVFLLMPVLGFAGLPEPALSASTSSIRIPSWDKGPSTAFFYGAPVPTDLLAQFDWVVVEADSAGAISTLRREGTEVFAYVSVGEAERERSWYREINRRWFLGVNRPWNSDIVDLTQPGWHQYLLGTRMQQLWEKGYRAFFLDTLDSYMAAVGEPGVEAKRAAQAQGLVTLIRAMTQRFPGVKLLLNRGFEVLPAVHDLVVGVAAESLFFGWDPSGQQYVPVREEDRAWLLGQLKAVRERHRLPIIVIDYLPPEQRDLARQTATRIADLGFVPWIANPSLNYLGIGSLEVVPRRILALYDSAEAPHVADTVLHRLLAMPMEHLGYIPEYLDVRRDPLPEFILTGRYAGIVTWFTDDELPASARYRNWLLKQLDAGMRVAIIGHVGFEPDADFLKRLGLAPSAKKMKQPLAIVHADELTGFEASPAPRLYAQVPWRVVGSDLASHLTLEDATGQRVDAVLTGPWGGMAFAGYEVAEGFEDRLRWIVHPFDFLRRALALPPIPAPDVTTENGRRLLTVHLDGDGFASRSELPGEPFASQVILGQVLTRFPLPTSVSVIEGELSPQGLYPHLSGQLEPIARMIFRLPHVEIASHTYSHPFNWQKVEEKGTNKGYYLDIPGYVFDLRREIEGSVAYITQQLAPPGKPVRLLFWSGDAVPGAQALAMTKELGLLNINGGDTIMTQEHPSLTRVAPLGRPVERYYQVYAPVQNENLYTNHWDGPFYGYRRAIETFQLTDQPRRLKPISIYYHMYSGSKPAGVKALEKVYQWALEQETLPLWVSEYILKVEAFQRLTLGRRLDGGWQIRSLGELRTLRLDQSFGWPDLDRSQGVIGVRDLPQGRYVSVAGPGPAVLYLVPSPPARPYLEQANARVERWERRTDRTLHIRLSGHVPVRLRIGGVTGACRIVTEGKVLYGRRTSGGWETEISEHELDGRLVCEEA